MTLTNISLCLPEFDVTALSQKRSVVAVTQRFIVPDRSFALLPCSVLPDSDQLQEQYHSHVLNEIKLQASSAEQQTKANYWARCVLCQQVSEEAIAALSQLTIWKKEFLFDQLQNGSLFLSFLRVYALPVPVLITPAPACDQLYKFVPLSNYIDVDTASPLYSDDEFTTAKQAILEPDTTIPLPPEPKPVIDKPDVEQDDILNSDNWVDKISEVGNSSDGHTFEKLVRKGLTALGFSNSLNQSQVSLDPDATGGAGGLDFYADEPYPIVGECKATASGSVGDPATQLHKLGLKYLPPADFERAAKLILAAGRITDHSNQVAVGHRMNVIRPETLQALVELKLEYEAFKASDIEASLQAPPFGTGADDKIFSLVQKRKKDLEEEAQYLPRRRQIIQTIKELSTQPFLKKRTAFSVVEVRSHHNAKYQPFITDESAKSMLTELSSPLSGFLGKEQHMNEQAYFYFKKDMP